MNDITKNQWDSLIKSILDKKCVLFLGPGITINYNKKNAMEMIYEKISQDSTDIAYHKSDNLLIFKNNDLEVDYRPEIVNFFSNDFSNELIEKLADIPFHLIISVSPDHTLINIFKQKKYQFQENYLSKTNKKKIEYDIREVPLLYNLFGDIDDDMSIIFSHFNLFEYLERGWVDSNSLPEPIKILFNKENTSNIIFLGFEFDKWYYQFILYLFKLDYTGCRRYAAFQEKYGNEMESLCESNYHITFINRDMKDFVEKLVHDFPEDKLRKPKLESEKPKKWKKDQFIQFLNNALNSNDWNTLCLSHFYDVYNDFKDGQTKSTQINMLIDYVTRNEQFKYLFDICNEHNPFIFEKYSPYYD